MEHPPSDSEEYSHLVPIRMVEVLRIPADGSDPEVYQVRSVSYENINRNFWVNETKDIEKFLKLVPDLRGFKDVINLKYRCLFDREPSGRFPPKKWHGRYFIYKCTSKKVELPQNRSYTTHSNVYGDAFVFKLNEIWSRDENGAAVFGNMEDFRVSIEARTVAYRMLKEMLKWGEYGPRRGE